METPEGYYASEHEIVWLHILLSWGYSLRGEKEKSYVETKIASNLLSTNWSDEGRFDDSFLRIIIATLWLMNDSWDEAKVDFRVAYELDKSQKWILRLLELESPPKDFILVLGGVGPEPEWHPNFKLNPLRGIRGMKFTYVSRKSNLTLSDSSHKEIQMFITPDSKNWYTRHQVRDNEIQDLIQDSRYGQQILASTLKATGRSALGIAGGVVVGTLGTALGIGIAYLGVEAQSTELIAFGIAFIPMSIVFGYEIASEQVIESIHDAKEDLDTSEYYRFVRFLPDYAWVGFSDSLNSPIKIKKKDRTIFEISKTNQNKNVFIFHYSDVMDK